MANDLENLIKSSERFAETLIKFETHYNDVFDENLLMTIFEDGEAHYKVYTKVFEEKVGETYYVIGNDNYILIYEGMNIGDYIQSLDELGGKVSFDLEDAIESIIDLYVNDKNMNKYCVDIIIYFSETNLGDKIRFWYITKVNPHIHYYYIVTEPNDSIFGDFNIYKLFDASLDKEIGQFITRESLFERLSSNGVCGWPY